MTVIAWDGETLAADRLISVGGFVRTGQKIYRGLCPSTRYPVLYGAAGDAAAAAELVAWYEQGADACAFPESCRSTEHAVQLLVVNNQRSVCMYESTPYPVCFDKGYFALGSGRDIAMTAMHLGHDARRAVELACKLDTNCGNGCETLAFLDEDHD